MSPVSSGWLTIASIFNVYFIVLCVLQRFCFVFVFVSFLFPILIRLFAVYWILHFRCTTHTSMFASIELDRRMNTFCVLIRFFFLFVGLCVCCYCWRCCYRSHSPSPFSFCSVPSVLSVFLSNLFRKRSISAHKHICHSMFRSALAFLTDFRLHHIHTFVYRFDFVPMAIKHKIEVK